MKENEPRFSTKGALALVALAAIYGLSIAITRYLGDGIGILEQWYLRFGIAFIVGALVFHRRIAFRKFLHLPREEWTVLLFRVVVGQVIGVWIYTLSVQRTDVGVVAFMDVIPMSAILGVILFHEKLSLQRGLLLAMSFVGAAIVVVENLHGLLQINVGALLTLVALVFYSLMLVTRRWHTGVLNNQEISVAMAGIAAVMTYVLSVVLYHRWSIPAGHWSGSFTLVLLAAGCLSYAMNYLMNYGFEHVSAVIAGNILSLEEFFGPLFGYLFYGEMLSARVIVGGLIILLSVILMNRIARREHQPIQVATIPD